MVIARYPIHPLTMNQIAVDEFLERVAQGDRQFHNLDLPYICLTNVNLSGLDLRGANFRGSTFIWADLRGANLEGADLRGATFLWTSLHSTNLAHALLGEDDGASSYSLNQKESAIAPSPPLTKSELGLSKTVC